MVTALRPKPPAVLEPPAAWYTPHPLWREIPRPEMPARRGVPVILRFATDTFMEDLIAVLESGDPERLAQLVAQPETWRDKPAVTGWDQAGHDRFDRPLKLYQAAHRRFYLVSGALACRMPGVPDKTLDTGQKEAVFFVIRQLDGDGREYAWSVAGWTRLEDPQNMLLDSEERQPLFPFHFEYEGVTRRLFAGLVPIASKEAAPSATSAMIGTVNASADPRPGLFEQQVTAALWAVRKWYDDPGSVFASRSERRAVEHALAYALLDMLALLKDNVTALYNAIVGGGIHSNTAQYGNAAALAALIRNANELEDVLKAIDGSSTRDYLLNSMGADGDVGDAPGMEIWEYDNDAPSLHSWVTTGQDTSTMPLQTAFATALTGTTYVPQPAEYPALPKSDPGGGKFHVIRMVYEQPQCKRLTISQPTREFLLAPFFDPDAPVRPIRIAMPVDTTIEGLKKYDKGVAVLVSDQLKAQMNRVSSLKEMIDGNTNPEGTLDLGLICSLSIPIITICALILLLLVVNLLNIIFHWLPFFMLCLPFPLPRKASGG